MYMYIQTRTHIYIYTYIYKYIQRERARARWVIYCIHVHIDIHNMSNTGWLVSMCRGGGPQFRCFCFWECAQQLAGIIALPPTTTATSPTIHLHVFIHDSIRQLPPEPHTPIHTRGQKPPPQQRVGRLLCPPHCCGLLFRWKCGGWGGSWRSKASRNILTCIHHSISWTRTRWIWALS